MLIIFGGLPGTGKSTIAQALAARRSAAYVRVDEIEHALAQDANIDRNIGPAGYLVAYAIASSNLRLGADVVADSVNPVPESRQGWRDVARKATVAFAEIELVCSDPGVHRRRIEGRTADIPGFALPTWVSVQAHEYVPWTTDRLVIDTAIHSANEAVTKIEDYLAQKPSSLISRTAPKGP